MISKELFSKMLGHKIIDCSDVDIDNDIEYTLEDSTCAFINIYELAYKCKEWALSNTFFLSSELFGDNEGVCYAYKKLSSKSPVCSCTSDTEPEAIFSACQWILDNKGK